MHRRDVGFCELLGCLYFQDLAPNGPDVFSRADILRMMLWQDDPSPRFLMGVDLANGPDRTVVTRREAGTWIIVDDIVNDFPPTPEQRAKLLAWYDQFQSRRQPQ